jgi:hypothetical protein
MLQCVITYFPSRLKNIYIMQKKKNTQKGQVV